MASPGIFVTIPVPDRPAAEPTGPESILMTPQPSTVDLNFNMAEALLANQRRRLAAEQEAARRQAEEAERNRIAAAGVEQPRIPFVAYLVGAAVIGLGIGLYMKGKRRG